MTSATSSFGCAHFSQRIFILEGVVDTLAWCGLAMLCYVMESMATRDSFVVCIGRDIHYKCFLLSVLQNPTARSATLSFVTEPLTLE